MNKAGDERQDEFDERVIHVGAGFTEREHPYVRETLSALRPHLGRWNADDVDVEVSVHDRGGKEQSVTLRTTLPGFPPLVANAADQDLTRALGEAKRELISQIDRHLSEREPMKNRRLRETIRHPESETGRE
jgi:ribosome-associated translation inhibitor RaiA